MFDALGDVLEKPATGGDIGSISQVRSSRTTGEDASNLSTSGGDHEFRVAGDGEGVRLVVARLGIPSIPAT